MGRFYSKQNKSRHRLGWGFCHSPDKGNGIGGNHTVTAGNKSAISAAYDTATVGSKPELLETPEFRN